MWFLFASIGFSINVLCVRGQAKAGEEYPCPYSITALMAVAASIQGVAYALCVERVWSQWNLGWDIRLFTVAVSVSFFEC